MLIQDIYQLCNYISNKEKSGNAFTINQFNSLIEVMNRDFFKKKVEESGYFKEGRIAHAEDIQSSKLMRELVVNEAIAVSGSASYTFAYILGLHDSDNDVLIEPISEEEYHDRVGDSVIAPSANAPVCMLRGDELVIKPDTIANIEISYYRYPNTPFLDYYIDVNDVIQFLGAGATHTWVTGEIDSSGVTHTTGDADWNSLTVELEFNADMHNDFMNDLLSRVGLRLEKAGVVQMAEQWKQEQKQM